MAAIKLTCLACGQVNRLEEERLDRGPKCAVCGAALVTGRAVEVDLATLEKAARTDGMPLVVDFWAPWCGPCRAMAPEFERAARRLRGRARLVKLNTEAEPGAGPRHGIRGIPTMVKFAGGREVSRQAGAMSSTAIEAWALS